MTQEIAAISPKLISENLVHMLSDGTPRLVGGRCKTCGALSFPRADVCTECLSLDVETVYLSSEGQLYSYSVVHQAPQGWKVPYTLGYIDLPEGIRVLAHIDASPEAVVIDKKYRLSLDTVATDNTGAELSTYTFIPA